MAHANVTYVIYSTSRRRTSLCASLSPFSFYRSNLVSVTLLHSLSTVKNMCWTSRQQCADTRHARTHQTSYTIQETLSPSASLSSIICSRCRCHRACLAFDLFHLASNPHLLCIRVSSGLGHGKVEHPHAGSTCSRSRIKKGCCVLCVLTSRASRSTSLCPIVALFARTLHKPAPHERT